MVGVPRSTGCRICVQRRVRCDGARPTCNNCRKGGRPCPGYGPGVKFQDEGPKLRQKYQQRLTVNQDSDDDGSSLALTPSSTGSSTGFNTPKPWNILGLDINDGGSRSRMNVFGFVEGKTKEYQNINLFELLYTSNSTADIGNISSSLETFSMFPSPVLSPEVQQMQLLATFTNDITPPEARFMPKAMRGQSAWLSQIPDYTGASLLLDSAVRAVTLAHVGRLHKNETFIMESRPYYGKALRLLHAAVSDQEMGMDNKTLCATILLSFYEMFASDSDASWIRHAGGAGALMRLRGAKRHRYGFDRDIFLAYRHTLVIEAMSLDTSSFLDEPEWRELTKQIYSDLLANNQIPSDRIVIYDVVEEFFSQMAAISTSSANAWHLNKKIEAFGVSEDDDLHSTYEKLQSHHDALYKLCKRWTMILAKAGLSPSLRPVDDLVMPFQYTYTNVFIASFYVGFWTTIMLCNANLYPLAQILELDTDFMVAENEEYAMEACRSAEFMLTSSFLGPFFTIYALRFAFRVFKPGDIRSDWALCKLVEIGDHRMQFAKNEIGGGPGGVAQKPEVFVESARRRLEAFAKEQKLRKQMEQQIWQEDAFTEFAMD